MFKKILGILFFLLLLNLSNGFSQTKNKSDEEQMKEVIEKTFMAMKSVDSVSLSSCFMKEAVLQVSQIRPDGNTNIRQVSITSFIKNVMSRKPGEMDERVLSWGPIQIDREIASVWVPYEFYLNGVLSHKGVDIFLFVKFNGEWKIQTLMYNMQKV